MQKEIELIKEEIKVKEDELLKLMEEEEETLRWLKEQEKVMKEEKEKFNREIAENENKISEIIKKIEEENKKRNMEVEKVDKGWYERYERIRKNKRLALAPLIVDENGNGICGGCKFAVRPQAVIEVKRKKSIKTCDNCARIWYIEEQKQEVS